MWKKLYPAEKKDPTVKMYMMVINSTSAPIVMAVYINFGDKDTY